MRRCRSIAGASAVALFLVLMAVGLPQIAAGLEPNGGHVEIEARFFEVPEAVAIEFGLLSMPDAGGEQGGKAAPAAAGTGDSFNGPLTSATVGPLLRKLSAAKGVRLLSSPRVTTRSGQRAVVEIIREFRYATEFEFDKAAAVIVPKAFETRNIGVTLEVEPSVSGGVIRLALVPQLVELEGFLRASDNQPVPLRGGRNIGADLNLQDLAAVPVPKDTVLIPMFTTRKINCDVALGSGQSVVVGGLKRDNREGDGKPANPRLIYVIVTARLLAVSHGDVLPIAASNPKDAPGFVRSPFAPDSKPIDARDLPAGTELQCPVTKKLFRLP